MTFSESIRTCLAKATTWQGRAARSEYWYFVLFNFSCLFVAALIDRMLGTSFTFPDPTTGELNSLFYGWVYVLVALALFLPNLAVLVRRLHDTNHSGWWYWIVLVPLIGAILLLVWFCSRGTNGNNAYGPDPLGADLAPTFS